MQINAGVKEGSSRVVISDNVILQGSNGTQGIFIRAEDLTNRHSDFTIENNLYNGNARNAITLIGVDGATVRGNTVTSAPPSSLVPGGGLEAGINLTDTTKVVVDRNLAPLLLANGSNPGSVWSNNIDLWDSKQKFGVALDSVFAAKSAPAGYDMDAYALKAGGLAATMHAGFVATDGIGAASFDLARAGSYGHLDGFAALVPFIA